MGLHERKTTRLTVYCGLAVMVVLVAVAPAVWRNWAAIRLALGRIYSDFRDYPEMVTFIHSIVEVVRMKRRRF